MELSWKWLRCCCILFVYQLCNGHPINLEDTLADQHTQLLTGLVGVLLTICSLVFLVGCLCCQRRNNFKEFHDSPVVASVQSDLDHGHVNPIANGEFTIFTPLSPPLFNNNVFLPREQFIVSKLESYILGDTDLSSWFSESDEDFPRVKLKYIRELGRGKFGKIVEGSAQDVTRHDGEWTQTIVRILDSDSSHEEKLLFLKDALMYRCGSHPNVLSLYGKCLETVPFLLLQEYCQDDLKTYLKSVETEENALSNELQLLWCTQLASALKHIHQHKIVHSDLAARNCRLTTNLALKLGDYSLAPIKYPVDYYHGISSVPLRWCDPESIVFKDGGIDLEPLIVDNNVWSLGVTIWEIFQYGEQPYSTLNDEEVISQVLESNIRLKNPSLDLPHLNCIYQLMQSCWNPIDTRPSVSEIYIILSDFLQLLKGSTKQNVEVDLYDDFDKKWESLKPNSMVKNDHISDSISIEMNESMEMSKPLSPSMNNLHGSLDDLLDKNERRARYSFEDELKKNERSFNRNSSGSETEDENWRKRVERGAVAEKVRMKSRSVADLMILTHVDYSESESETPFPSLDYRVNYRNIRGNLENSSHAFGSEGNLLNLEDTFQEELRKLQEERRDSLLFVPDTISRKSSSLAKEPESLELNVNNNNSLSNSKLLSELSSPDKIHPHAQVFNVFNVTVECRSPLNDASNLKEIINVNKLADYSSAEPKLDLVSTDSAVQENIPIELDESHDIGTTVHNITGNNPASVILHSNSVEINPKSGQNKTSSLELEEKPNSNKISQIISEGSKPCDILEATTNFVESEKSHQLITGGSEDMSQYLNQATIFIVSQRTQPLDAIGQEEQSDGILYDSIPKSGGTHPSDSPKNIESSVSFDTDISEDSQEVPYEPLIQSFEVENYPHEPVVNSFDEVPNEFTDSKEESQIHEKINTLLVDESCPEIDQENVIEFEQDPLEHQEKSVLSVPVDKHDSEHMTTKSNEGTSEISTTLELNNTSMDSIRIPNEDLLELVVIEPVNVVPSRELQEESIHSQSGFLSEPVGLDLTCEDQVIRNREDEPASQIQINSNDLNMVGSVIFDDEPENMVLFTTEKFKTDIQNESFQDKPSHDICNIQSSSDMSDRSESPSETQTDVKVDVSDIKMVLENHDLPANSCNRIQTVSNEVLFEPENDFKEKQTVLVESDVQDVQTSPNHLRDDSEIQEIFKESTDSIENLERPCEVVNPALLNANYVFIQSEIENSSQGSKSNIKPSDLCDISPVESKGTLDILNKSEVVDVSLNGTKMEHKSLEENQSEESEPNVSDLIKCSLSKTSQDTCEYLNHSSCDKIEENLENKNNISDVKDTNDNLIDGSQKKDENCDITIGGGINSTNHCDEHTNDAKHNSKRVAYSTVTSTKNLSDRDISLSPEVTNKETEMINFDLSANQEKIRPNPLTHSNAFISAPKKRNVSLNLEEPFLSLNPFDQALGEGKDGMFSSNFEPVGSTETDNKHLTYSLETWDNFLDNTMNIQDHNLFDSFTSEPKSLLFIESPARPDGKEESQFDEKRKTEKDTLLEASSSTVNEDGNRVDGPDLINVKESEAKGDSSWESGEGWFLHPQTNEELSGNIQITPDSDTYVGFGIDDEIMSAIRNELLSKLPHVQGSNQERLREVADLDPQETNEVFLMYNVYNTPLSPIPEEESCTEGSDSNTPKQKLEDEEDSDWSDRCAGENTESHSAHTLEGGPKGPLNRHTLSEDSCCSNDTLFNLEELNFATSETEKANECNLRESEEIGDVHMLNVRNVIKEFLSHERVESGKQEHDQSQAQNPSSPLPENNPWKQSPEPMSSCENTEHGALPETEENVPEYANTLETNPEEAQYGNCKQNEEDINYDEYVNLKNVKNSYEYESEKENDYINTKETSSQGEEKIFDILTDIRFSGPSDSQLMSTSFSESNNCDDQEWDSGSDSRSSSSGEFIWKEGEHEESLKALRAAPQDVLEDIKPMEKINEDRYEDSDVSSSLSDEEGETPEFIPSAWDKFAMPSKSALRSPEKTLNKSGFKKAKVWFKKQKYHCIYEYPKEPESPVMQSQDLWKVQPDHNLAFWEYDGESYPLQADDSDAVPDSYKSKNISNNKNMYQLTNISDFMPSNSGLDEEFFISSSAQPFDMATGSGCQFFPGSSNWSADSATSDNTENATPDSGVEDMTPCSQGEGEFTRGASRVPTLKQLASESLNRTKQSKSKSDDALGGLRHTRNKLKLDLPPSPSAFSTDKMFTIENTVEPVIREKPTFTTFGKSRFLVQHVDTPKDENKRNVSFEALPYTPLVIKSKKESHIVEKNNDHNLTVEKDQVSDDIKSKIETVKGEASLLDSTDEDSGIETSTLKRKFSNA